LDKAFSASVLPLGLHRFRFLLFVVSLVVFVFVLQFNIFFSGYTRFMFFNPANAPN
jgi:hypothetical protein